MANGSGVSSTAVSGRAPVALIGSVATWRGAVGVEAPPSPTSLIVPPGVQRNKITIRILNAAGQPTGPVVLASVKDVVLEDLPPPRTACADRRVSSVPRGARG